MSKENREKKDARRSDDAPRQGSADHSKRDFSWYGGEVDEAVVREIVRLKKAQKS